MGIGILSRKKLRLLRGGVITTCLWTGRMETVWHVFAMLCSCLDVGWALCSMPGAGLSIKQYFRMLGLISFAAKG